MMCALYINGSPHNNGATYKLLEMIKEKLQGTYTTEWVNVYDLSTKPCRGCLRCRPNGVCILPEDDGHRAGKMIAEADLIVIGSPVYWGNITAPLKMVFDRNVTTFEHFLNGDPTPKLIGKEALIVVASGTDLANHEKPNQGGVQCRLFERCSKVVVFMWPELSTCTAHGTSSGFAQRLKLW